MARFNTQSITTSVTAAATIASPQSFTEFTGTAPYTVTLPSPVLCPGSSQTFYNATAGTVTLSTPSGLFGGLGSSGASTQVIPTNTVVSITSDGTNYVVLSEDGSALVATTGSFTGNVTANGASATVSLTPQTVTIAPTGASTIDNVNIGATTRGSGAFNTLAANSAVTFTANTTSSSTTTGTVVVTGGLGVSGAVYAAGLYGPLTGTLQTAAQPNITSTGNLTPTGLTVDTNTLYVDTTNHRLGVGTTSPRAKFHTNVSTNQNFVVGGPTNFGSGISVASTNDAYSQNYPMEFRAGSILFTANNTDSSGGNIVFNSGGEAEKARIDSSGNVGIGTNSPATYGKLAVNGSTYINGNLTLTNTSMGNYGSTIQGAQTAASTGNAFLFSDSGGANVLTLAVGGNVGMGTQSPAYKLHVVGTAGIADPRITAISATIAATATKVFVYDTRKDSDRGAWRKRCQNTSWYNETLNTATRGSRKEFPAVAVIVYFNNSTLTIYDGDDPTMPMWMTFPYVTTATQTWYGFGSSLPVLTGLTALNGIIGICNTDAGNSSSGATLIKFISDGYTRYTTTSGYNGNSNINIAQRATTSGIVFDNSTGTINRQCNDISMTVLPNATIDAATGLPIPTIAVATNSGIYVIHNTGLINSINATDAVEYNYWRSVSFTKDYKMIINSTYLGVSNNVVHVCDIPYTNFSGNLVNTRIVALNSRYYHSDSMTPNLKPGIELARIASTGINTFAIGGTGAVGFTLVAEAPETVSGVNSSAMVAYVLPTYNTGWMVGNIKGAWLSSSTAESIGTELVTNGTFTSNVTGWTNAGTSITYSATNGGCAIVTPSASAWTGAYQAITTVVGRRYIATATFITGSGYYSLSINETGPTYAGKTDYSPALNPSNQAMKVEWTASTTTAYLTIDNLNTTNTNPLTVDNVSCKLADDDRSVNNKGLVPYGTITKSLIDTGNDLVAYSGFSGSNYLVLPFSSNLDIGASAFTISIWVKTGSSGWQGLMGYYPTSASANSWALMIRNDGYPSFYNYTNDNQGNNNNVVSTSFATNWLTSTSGWQHIVVTRTPMSSSPSYTMYVNGQAVATQNIGFGYSYATGGRLTVGYTDFLSANCSGSLALAKVSLTPMSPAQVTKMFNDEKMLFTTGAKGCIYGSSAVINDVAFDDATNLLHIGTSAGRSVFNGLRRVDNTATAVSASISASNGLVAEQ